MKNNKTLPVRMKISRLNLNEGEEVGFIGVFEDLTQIKKMEDKILQAQQLAAVGKFSAALAHEIRNPLASLSGSIQVLKRGLDLKGDYYRLMNIVIKETERLNAIVSDFLNYSQPRTNKAVVIDMKQFLEDMIILIKNREDYDSSIRLQLQTDAEHLVVQGDQEGIKQMVWNLCINGMQAMPQGGTLTLSLRKVSGFKHQAFETNRKGFVLTVADEGAGIPENKIKNIFDPFFTTKDEGIGLGLSTVYQIANRLGGCIGVESEIGRGTIFNIYLPDERTLVDKEDSDVEEDSEKLTLTERRFPH